MNLTDDDVACLMLAHCELFTHDVTVDEVTELLDDAFLRSQENDVQDKRRAARGSVLGDLGRDLQVDAERALMSGCCTVTADSMRAQAFVRDAWLRLALEDQPKPEPELTPAERTWRAHKGFTR